ncbi:hypothetical protein JH313_19065 [Xanthomonas campestris pv. campestris]|nr:hypothetical protein JH313_19065 [Xanthomonas campestris pv. campestris]
MLLEGLETPAQREAPAAHLAIAKLLESQEAGFSDEDERVRRQVRHDGAWTSQFVSFVEVEASGLRMEEKHRHHLLAAAQGENIRALMETAERGAGPPSDGAHVRVPACITPPSPSLPPTRAA